MNELTCVYCESKKNVAVWEKTGENVCLSCQVEFLAQGFDLSEEDQLMVGAAIDMLR